MDSCSRPSNGIELYTKSVHEINAAAGELKGLTLTKSLPNTIENVASQPGSGEGEWKGIRATRGTNRQSHENMVSNKTGISVEWF
jgi:hypothetical protein